MILPRAWLRTSFALVLVLACTEPPTTVPIVRAGESGAVLVPALVSAGKADPQAYALLGELCTKAPHRLSGSEDAARAVEWGRATMQRLGLENVRLEPVLVPHWVRGTVEELEVVEPSAHAGERLPILALGGSLATPEGGITAPLMAVSDFDELHRRAEEARGKLVLFRRPMDRSKGEPFEAYGGAVNQRSTGAIEAAGVGGVGALVRSMTFLQDDEPHTGAMRVATDGKTVPAAAVSTNACDRLVAWLEAGQRVVLRLALSAHWESDVASFNVVGDVVGRERPQEVVLIGGHLDGWDVGQGAHDDGSGCAHVLEAGRLLLGSKLGRPRRTVRCVLYMNEENGLKGAVAYRDAHSEELAHHVLAIESDRGGDGAIGYASDANGPAAEVIERLFGGPPHERGGGADVSPLAEFGVPLAGLVPDPTHYFDYHHSRHDVLTNVRLEALELGAISLASMAFLAADAPGDWPRNVKAEGEGH